MVVLSFSVLKANVLDGSKTRTMRRASSKRWEAVYAKWQKLVKMANSPGGIVKGWIPKIPLQVYWKQRTPQQEFLFDAVVTNITKKKLRDLGYEEWKLDGFQDEHGNSATSNGLLWFQKTYQIQRIEDGLDFEVYIIEFRRVT